MTHLAGPGPGPATATATASPHLERARAHLLERAPRAVRVARVARPPPVAEQVQVELELFARWRDREHLVVHLLERRARPKQPEARTHARDVRVDRHVAHP